jgi:Mor family transcriptional regulator
VEGKEMQYKNGKEVLPRSLLSELQKYIQGELIYIPTAEAERKGWGEINGTRDTLRNRNLKIYELYKEGQSVYELMSLFNLSEDSIRKIITKQNRAISSSLIK